MDYDHLQRGDSMRKRSVVTLYFTIFALALLLSGCQNSATGPSGSSTASDPGISSKSISIPTTIQTNLSGSSGGYVSSLQAYQGWSVFMTPPASATSTASNAVGAQASNSQQYTWTQDGLTVVWSYYEDGSGRHWSITLSGTYDWDGNGDTTISNFTFIEVDEAISSYQGSFKVYDPTQPSVTTPWYEWNWYKDAASATDYPGEIYHWDFTSNDANSPFKSIKLAANAGGTEGELAIYDNPSESTYSLDPLIEAGWTASGHLFEDHTTGTSDGTLGSLYSPLSSGDDTPA